jgi:hypothetical protein
MAVVERVAVEGVADDDGWGVQICPATSGVVPL